MKVKIFINLDSEDDTKFENEINKFLASDIEVVDIKQSSAFNPMYNSETTVISIFYNNVMTEKEKEILDLTESLDKLNREHIKMLRESPERYIGLSILERKIKTIQERLKELVGEQYENL